MQSLLTRVSRLSLNHTHTVTPTLSSTLTVTATAPLTTSIRHYHPRRDQVQSRTYRGIFCGKHITFGNNVSHSERHTRRTFKPNVQLRKRLYSEVLERDLRNVEVTTAALRTFDKYGGLDRYLLRSPLHRLDFGLTRELRTDMELKLLDYPELAEKLNLQDVIERLQRPGEVRRLRRVVLDRQEDIRASGLFDHPYLKQRIPDGTVRINLQLEPEQLEQAQREAQEYLDKQKQTQQIEFNTNEIASRTFNGIIAPRNVVTTQQAQPRAPRGAPTRHSKRATFEHPFTHPIPKDKTRPVAVAETDN